MKCLRGPHACAKYPNPIDWMKCNLLGDEYPIPAAASLTLGALNGLVA